MTSIMICTIRFDKLGSRVAIISKRATSLRRIEGEKWRYSIIVDIEIGPKEASKRPRSF
jgi:hypothetical protein